jgi:hypothetical protein
MVMSRQNGEGDGDLLAIDQRHLDLSDLVDQALRHDDTDDEYPSPPEIEYALRCHRCRRIDGIDAERAEFVARIGEPCGACPTGILRAVHLATSPTAVPPASRAEAL